MPEGPEIRRAADRVHRALAGKPTTEVWCAFEDVAEAFAALSGQRVEKVSSWGKAMLITFESGQAIYSHNQLYGRWYVMKAGNTPKTNRQLRLAIHNRTHSALLYSASDIELLDAERLTDQPFLARLGPDLYDDELTPETLALRLSERRFSGRQLAALLLDQRFVAGLGNYLRAEVLHTARLDPRRCARQLDEGERLRLSEEILRLAEQSYLTGGLTNDLQRVEALKEEGERRRHYRFWVYKRDGRPCYRCGTRIVREDVGGRALFWCPGCQV